MLSGSQASPFFQQKLIDKKQKPILSIARSLLSMGSIGYYLNGEDMWQTRIFIYNHFSLLNDAPFSMKWKIFFYDRWGSCVTTREGECQGQETIVLETRDIPGLDRYGVVWVHIEDNDKKMMLHELYSSVFFTEFYVPNTQKTVMAHCLSGSLKASHAVMNHMSTSWVTPMGYRPFLLIANSCRFHPVGHTMCGKAQITFINSTGAKKTVQLSKMAPRACQKIDIFDCFPEIKDHIGVLPYSMHIVGKNILHKPFILQTNGTIVTGEHL